MKCYSSSALLILSLILPAISLVVSTTANAVELVKWERIPLPVHLNVGVERIIFVEKNVRVGFPPELNGKLRVQSTGGTVYLKAEGEFQTTRLQLQDVQNGEIILLDVTTKPNKGTLEPIRLVYSGEVTQQRSSRDNNQSPSNTNAQNKKKQKASYSAPLPALLTRYAAQNLYAPLRTVEAVPGVQSIPLSLSKCITTLYPSARIQVIPLAGWRANGVTVVALKLTNLTTEKVVLDPRMLQGQFLTATFQHQWLGPTGTPEDTTALYLVMKGKPENSFIAEPVLSKKVSKNKTKGASDES
ncbi:TIGR03749 family integrating conjugative element protein [Xenorhabdus griffiniae]|uniref:TIGR03749 family integrating conjugative element protein n=1 Tax=Xenorhabdus griffiniae TaxID=351672 RepID=A0ABY9XF02_9GAMM|nr:TIGR03749 family integrating conjugative element protein [Xenorhabdus griffiniae]MBD1226003.1 TIGR03749 family integrating conjugative element protein [Xenorhabdus griffiniae]MBE8585879.1 TIGR03749 family integrating conjugative element protein [Xenorhabdus griffiniae]WMV71425.1 TIGR03749 family integrating conjugative element protein [Xenorhabdus griffiniae]WNH01102.1 TIGR03749 family integrating conjugative element protein [Xenorhabdus griffiniae]